MGEHKETYAVEIAGVPLLLKASYDKETVNQLVDYVDQKIKQALPMTKNSSFQNAALLASLNIAEELFLTKKRAEKELEELEGQAVKILSDLESSQISRVGLASEEK